MKRQLSVFKRVAGLVVIGSIVSGCATLNEAECISANWYDLGFDNALSGKKSSFVSEHTSACKKYQISPNFDLYREGWQQGVNKFCTAQSGWRYGIAGNYYRNTCSADKEAAFLEGYNPAKRIAQKKREINDLKNNVRNLRERITDNGLSKDEHTNVSMEHLDARLDLQLLELELFQLESRARDKGFY
jgi:hypothetical protein